MTTQEIYNAIMAGTNEGAKRFLRKIKEIAEQKQTKTISLSETEERIIAYVMENQDWWFYDLVPMFSEGELRMGTSGGFNFGNPPMTMDFYKPKPDGQ